MATLAVSANGRSYAPLLPVGFHQTDVAGLERLCVEYFPGSRSRPQMMNTVSMVVSLATRLRIFARIWVSGPFMTEDENPEDCVITLVLVEDILQRLDDQQREFFEWFRDVPLYDKYRCYNYGIVLDTARRDYDRLSRFWCRQYGFHEEAGRRGVAELRTPTTWG
jgi:hypothetical protein